MISLLRPHHGRTRIRDAGSQTHDVTPRENTGGEGEGGRHPTEARFPGGTSGLRARGEEKGIALLNKAHFG